MKLSLLFAGLAALATALPAGADPDAALASRRPDPVVQCARVFVWCLGSCGGSAAKCCWKDCKEKAIKSDPKTCANYLWPVDPPYAPECDHAPAADSTAIDSRAPAGDGAAIDMRTPFEGDAAIDIRAPAEGNVAITCDDCHSRYYNCVALAFVPGLNCEEICRKRAQQSDDLCKTCDQNKYYPRFRYVRPSIDHERT